MKKLSCLEKFLSVKLKRRIVITGGMTPNPSKFTVEEATKILASKDGWKFGSCRQVLLYSTKGEPILVVKKNNRR